MGILTTSLHPLRTFSLLELSFFSLTSETRKQKAFTSPHSHHLRNTTNQLNTSTQLLSKMCTSTSSTLVNRNGPGSAVSSKALQGRRSVSSVMGTSVAVSRFLVRSCRG